MWFQLPPVWFTISNLLIHSRLQAAQSYGWNRVETLFRGVRAGGARLVSMSTDELLVEALRLPRRERARVAEQLLSSVEEPDDHVATAWAIELERRSRDVAEGRVQATDWDTARAEILKELDERRARRTTP